MKTKLEKIKIIVEIAAIVIAGTFAFFTWGLDYLSTNKANWLVTFDNALGYKLVEVNGVNQLCLDNDTNNNLKFKDYTGCLYMSSINIENRSNKALYWKNGNRYLFSEEN